MNFSSLILPAFFAGVLTFLAPCTFPLLPSFLAFIGGNSYEEFKDPEKRAKVERSVTKNALMYVLGFSTVFILLGSFFSLIGFAFAPYQQWIARIGGLFVIFFGFYLAGLSRLKIFQAFSRERTFHLKGLTPGKPASSFIFGAAFAFGWTPCVGPILGAVLALASTRSTVWQGALLLCIFSLGLAIPFMIVAFAYGSAVRYIAKTGRILQVVSIIGGIFLVVVGLFLFANSFGNFIGYFYRWFSFVNYSAILNYL